MTCTFSTEQITALTAPLDRAKVLILQNFKDAHVALDFFVLSLGVKINNLWLMFLTITVDTAIALLKYH